MKRGEIWTVAGALHYTSKPRPLAILQSDRFTRAESVTGCPLTTVNIGGRLFRIPIFPEERNGLRSPSWQRGLAGKAIHRCISAAHERRPH